jgi:hypothetical protein
LINRMVAAVSLQLFFMLFFIATGKQNRSKMC